jgi:predicted nucleic acid-binding protein
MERLDAFILDASVTVAWYYRDEADPYADAVARRFPGVKALVPSVWPLEVANAILIGERRKRDAVVTIPQFVSNLSALSIAVDEQNFARVFGAALALARDHDLSAYDASYVELAIRSSLPLATLDDRVRAAATALGIRLFQP